MKNLGLYLNKKTKNQPANSIRKMLTMLAIIALSGSIAMSQNTDKGFLMLKMGKFSDAKIVFSTALQTNKGNDIALYGLGEAYFALQQYDSAAVNYEAGTVANPTNAYNFIGWGKTLIALGNSTEAEKKLSIARKLGKKDANAFATIARAYTDGPNNLNEFAARDLENARKVNSKCSNIYLTEGLIFMKQKKVSDATSKFEQAIFFDSLNVEAYLELADIYGSTTVKQSAIDFLNTLLIKVPDCYIAYFKLGDIYYSMNKFNEAKTAYDTYSSKTKCTNDELEKYAYTLFFLKNYDKALDVVRQLSNNDPSNYIFIRLISYMDFETNEFAKGLESFNTFFTAIPPSKIIAIDYEYYAKTLAALNMDSMAIAAYQSAYNKDSMRISCIDEMAKLSMKQKKYPNAIGYYNLSMKKRQTPVPLDFFQIGRAYYMQAFKLKTDTINKVDSLVWAKEALAADSLFRNVCTLQPASYLGYMWRARANSLIDAESILGLSKPHYEQALTILLQNPTKYSKEIIEIYSYLGYYYYVTNNRSESINYWNKIIEIDPNNEKALAAIKDLTAHPK